MRTFRPTCLSALIFTLCLLPASLLAQRVFVSAEKGNDVNGCTITLPCRTFATAINAVAAGGEIVVLDSGGYGPVRISKAITIEAPSGVYAGISVPAGNDGVGVYAGDSEAVVLRGLTIYGLNGASGGISFASGAALHVESCVINGISGVPSADIYQASGGSLFVTDTTMRNGYRGIELQPVILPNSLASVDHCRIENEIDAAFIAFDGVKASVRDSIASGNLWGLSAGGINTPAELNVENCLVVNNSVYGIVAISFHGTIRVGGSTVANNGIGLAQSGSLILASYGNNHVAGNGTDISGTITPLSPN